MEGGGGGGGALQRTQMEGGTSAATQWLRLLLLAASASPLLRSPPPPSAPSLSRNTCRSTQLVSSGAFKKIAHDGLRLHQHQYVFVHQAGHLDHGGCGLDVPQDLQAKQTDGRRGGGAAEGEIRRRSSGQRVRRSWQRVGDRAASRGLRALAPGAPPASRFMQMILTSTVPKHELGDSNNHVSDDAIHALNQMILPCRARG